MVVVLASGVAIGVAGCAAGHGASGAGAAATAGGLDAADSGEGLADVTPGGESDVAATGADDDAAGPERGGGDVSGAAGDATDGGEVDVLEERVARMPFCTTEGVCEAGPEHAPDPGGWGPFPVGVKTLEFIGPDYQGEERPFLVEVWYPATEAAREGPHEWIDMADRAPQAVQEKFPDVELDPVLVEQVRDAELRSEDGPYPMVVFSHGAYGIRFQSVFWTTYLASHGYVVVAPDHMGNTAYDLVQSESYSIEDVGLNAFDRPIDIQVTLDEMLALNASDGFFRDVIDPARIGMAGHSFGGLTSFLSGCVDSRIKVIVPMTPVTSVVPIMACPLEEFPSPVMMMTGGIDNTLDTENEMRKGFAKLTGERHYFELKAGGHFTYSDICLLDLELVADALDIPTGGALNDGCGEENIPVDLAHPIIRQFSVGFLNHHLRDSPGSATWYDAAAGAAHSDLLVFETHEPDGASR